jgi:ankyrin repeat protein
LKYELINCRHNDIIFSLLCWWGSLGFDEIIATLLDHGANVNIHEGTPLQLACKNGHEAAVRVLLRYGANHRLDDGAAYKAALEVEHEGIKALLVQAETAMRAKEREFSRMVQQNGPVIMAQHQQRQYPSWYSSTGISNSSAFTPFQSDNMSRGQKRIFSQMSNPLSVSDLFRTGSVCGLVALDDEIRSMQTRERNRL